MASSETQTLQFVSWNVHGVTTKISSQPRLFFIIEELTRQGAEVVFLQETHIGSENYETLNRVEGWKCFFTVYDTESKGVAILIRDDVPFQYICHDEDYSGGYLVLFCYLHDELFTLVNVYNHKNDKVILNRLQEYLRETAEGVLVVGGDFNTVLDLTFDRKSQTNKHTHTPLRDMFEKFTASLNLIDTWVHLHPTEKAFTRSQNKSFSRLDMFLMPEDIIEMASSVKICKAKMVPKHEGDTNERSISDHDLVVLNLTLSKCFIKKMPDVGLRLRKFTYSRDKTTGRINGAEILSVINSLTDSHRLYTENKPIHLYKRYRCQILEILKEYFNDFLDRRFLPNNFTQNTCVAGTRKVFTVNYIIFTTILAKRLSMLLLAFPDNKRKSNTDTNTNTNTDTDTDTDTGTDTDTVNVSFLEKPVKIRWTFLRKIISDLYDIAPQKTDKGSRKGDKPNEIRDKCTGKRDKAIERYLKILQATGLTKDFSILDIILPPGDFRELQEGCPLTRTICSLILKYLEILITEKGYMCYICHYRKLVVIHNIPSGPQDPALNEVFEEFKRNGTKMKILKMDKS